jgi:peptidoglycan glycosyltransferase
MNDYLTGSNTDLSNALHNLLKKASQATVHGDDLYLTIKPKAQALAEQLLGDKCGAVVAMNPKTGAVYVMASSPGYNPNLIESQGGYAKVLNVRGSCHGSSALYNRATQGLYTPSSRFYDPGYCTEYGKQISNAGNPDQGGAERFGSLDLNTAMQHSVNSVFCNIGMKLGAKTIIDYAKRFGFYKKPPIETPANERFSSGMYKLPSGTLDEDTDKADPGRLAFGQYTMLTTPLQMAMVAATVGNGGVVPRPYLVQKIVGPDGSTIRTTKPRNLGRAIKPETAAALNHMMQLVVTGGTGTAAQIPGVAVAGKTGTAETSIPNVYTAWFVAFAPAQDPSIAIAVVLEKQLNGFGGAVSAPIAKQVMQSLLGR